MGADGKGEVDEVGKGQGEGERKRREGMGKYKGGFASANYKGDRRYCSVY